MEPSLKDQLEADYDRHEDAVEDAAFVPLWALADWLAKHVPNPGRGGDRSKPARPGLLTLDDLAKRKRRSRDQLGDLRKVAEAAPKSARLPDIAPRVYTEALRNANWNLDAANDALRAKGTRLRDHSGKQESVDAIKEAMGKRTAGERAQVIVNALDDRVVRVEMIDALTSEDRGELVIALMEHDRPESPTPLAESIERFEIDAAVFRVAKALHESRQRAEAHGVRSFVALDQLRDAFEQVSEDVAVLVARLNDAMEMEKATDGA